MRVSALALVAPILLAASAAASAGETVAVPAFKAVELNDGGHVTVRHGATQRVTLVEGSLQYTRFVMKDHTLRIESCFVRHCPRDYRIKVEIVTPSVLGLAVNDGGILRAEGAFPEQDSVAAAVSDGGIVDARAIPAKSVAAAVSDGGRVMVNARTNLAVHIEDGGAVTFWGSPTNIVKSIQDGGAVMRGAPGDINKPLAALSPRAEAPPPPVPPVPPVPPMGDGDEDE
jgi:Putative auto-transporter adhesin, head GIN domain